MFEMTAKQKQAFEHAAGLSASTTSHVILFFIIFFAVTWLFILLIGLHQKKDKGFAEFLGPLSCAILIISVVALIIHY